MMTGITNTQLPRLRTYARDLESERQRQKLPSVPVANTSIPALPGGSVSPVPKPPTTTSNAATATKERPLTITPNLPRLPTDEPFKTPVRTSQTTTNASLADELPTKQDHRPASVPPFHTLNTPPPKTNTSRGAEIETITIDNDESGATVITDTRRNRFNFFHALVTSLSAWWSSQTKARKGRQRPQYVVPETSRRKGLIQQATSHTGRQITGDLSQLRTLIKERTVTPTTPPDEAETIWTPNTETIYPLLEAPDHNTHFTNVSVTPRGIPKSTLPPASDPLPTTAHTPLVPLPEEETVPPPKIHSPVITSIPKGAGALSSTVDETVPTPKTILETKPAPATPIESQSTQQTSRSITTNALAISVVSLVTILAIGGVVLRDYLISEELQPPTTNPLPVNIPLTTQVLTETSRASILTTLTTLQTEATLPFSLYSFETAAGTLAAANLLRILSGDLDPVITNDPASLYIGFYERRVPFIIMNINDRSRVWGSLLTDEADLRNAFTPLIRTSPDGQFTDVRAGVYDLRSYRASTSNEELVYGFLNDRTLLLTIDQATFLLIAALATTTP